MKADKAVNPVAKVREYLGLPSSCIAVMTLMFVKMDLSM